MKFPVVVYPIFAAAVLLAGCAGTPERSDQLQRAHSAVDNLSSDPLAAQAASQQLEAARESLRQADEALEKHKSREVVDQHAYLAERQAQAGLAAVAEARAREEMAKSEAERNRVLMRSREREADAATQEARTAQAEAQSAQAQAKQAMQTAQEQTAEANAAREQLQRMQQAFSELQAKQTERGMVMTMGDVLFDTGQATLKRGADLTIDRLGKFLSENPEMKIVIEGHTDSVGTSEYNQELSERRARAVADALGSRAIGADRYEVRGRGEDYPVAGNDTAAGRQQNRRVEVVFSDIKGGFAPAASR